MKYEMHHCDKYRLLFQKLNIEIQPYSGQIDPWDLYDLLMDQERLETITKKMKLKAFW